MVPTIHFYAFTMTPLDGELTMGSFQILVNKDVFERLKEARDRLKVKLGLRLKTQMNWNVFFASAGTLVYLKDEIDLEQARKDEAEEDQSDQEAPK